MYVCMYVCRYVCVYVYLYVCMYEIFVSLRYEVCPLNHFSCTKFNHLWLPNFHVTPMNMQFKILGRSRKSWEMQRIWENTKYNSMYEIQESVKCYLFLIFTHLIWTHLLRSKPITHHKRLFKCLKRWFSFQF